MCINNENMHKRIFQGIIWLFPILFLFDNILGFNGYQFTIAGKSIRIILFSLSVMTLFCYSLYVLIEERIPLITGKQGERSLFELLKPIDYFVFLFIVGNFLWATVVPLCVRGEMKYSLKDFSTVLVLILYFPLTFLIRTRRMKLVVMEQIAYWLMIILALWHVVMYTGDRISPGFYSSFYDFIDIISFGTAVRTDVVYGFGIIRIIQVTSLLLLPGIFISIRYLQRGNWWHILALLLFTFAICVTYTKSIWFGYFFGLLIYLIGSMAICKDKVIRLRSLLILVVALAMIIVLNYTVFDNSIFERSFNTVRSGQSIENLQEELKNMESQGFPSDDIEDKQNELKDALGTKEANAKRAEQNKALFSKWKDSLLFGHGYGSYVDSCIRNEQFPYMYESTLPALAMKIGLIGCLFWAGFIVMITICACNSFSRHSRTDLFWWLGIAISYAMAVQTNPFLFTFTGISILLYLLIVFQEKWDSVGD